MFDILRGLGIIGVLVLVLILILLPFILTVLVGGAFATILGFTGIVWWAWMVLFYLVITSILSMGAKKD